MEKEKKEPTPLRGSRGSRVSRIANVNRGRAEENAPSKNITQPPKESSKIEPAEQSRGGRSSPRGSRIVRVVRRGQNRQFQRRNYRNRQPNRNTRRLERAQNAARGYARGARGRFRGRRRFFGMRRPFGRRSIYIAGLPKNVPQYRLIGLLRQEGRLLRCTLLKDAYGNSRGIAFAEMSSPRDALKVIQKWKGRKVEGNTIFVTFKRNPIGYRKYYSTYNNRFGNNRQFKNYGGYNTRYQRPRVRGIRGRGGRGRGF